MGQALNASYGPAATGRRATVSRPNDDDLTRAGVEILLDRPRRLMLDAYAFIEYDDKTGRDLIQDMLRLSKEMPQVKAGGRLPMSLMRDLLWASLLEDDPALTREQTSRLLTLRNMIEVLNAMLAALTKALPEAAKAASGERPQQAASEESPSASLPSLSSNGEDTGSSAV